MAEQQAEKGSIQVIERMMSLLDVLADMPGPVSLKILAQRTGLHPSTAHRILAVMTGAALVERQDAGTYALGIRLLELGNIVKSRINIRQVALPYMQQLHELIGEAVNLGIRHEDEIIYVERTSSGSSLVRVVYLVGGRAPLHLTSVGKLFLAQDDPQRVRAYATRTGLAGHTRNSITALPALERELNGVRINGMARDDEELELGVRCMAAGIYDDQGHLIAGLSISAPADRLEDAWLERLKATAGQISSALGYRGPAVRPAEPLRAGR